MTHCPSPPSPQTSFDGYWNELDYLERMVEYWSHQRQDSVKASEFTDRICEILNENPITLESIPGQGLRALCYEVEGDWEKSIEHRRQQLAFMDELNAISGGDAPGGNTKPLSTVLDPSVTIDAMWFLSCSLWENDEHLSALKILDEIEEGAEREGVEVDDYGLRDAIMADMN